METVTEKPFRVGASDAAPAAMDADSTEAAAALTSMFSKEAIPDHMQDGGGANLPTHHQLLLAQMMRNTTHPSLQVQHTLQHMMPSYGGGYQTLQPTTEVVPVRGPDGQLRLQQVLSMQNSAPPQLYLQQQVAGYGAQRLGGRVGHYGGAMVAADLSRGVDLANFGGSDPQQLEKAKPTQISAPPTTLPAAPVVSGHGQLVEGEAAIDQYVALQIVQAQDAYAVTNTVASAAAPPRHHECHQCKKKFVSQSKLARHMLVHTKEKPWVCGICGTNFTQKSALTVHSKRRKTCATRRESVIYADMHKVRASMADGGTGGGEYIVPAVPSAPPTPPPRRAQGDINGPHVGSIGAEELVAASNYYQPPAGAAAGAGIDLPVAAAAAAVVAANISVTTGGNADSTATTTVHTAVGRAAIKEEPHDATMAAYDGAAGCGDLSAKGQTEVPSEGVHEHAAADARQPAIQHFPGAAHNEPSQERSLGAGTAASEHATTKDAYRVHPTASDLAPCRAAADASAHQSTGMPAAATTPASLAYTYAMQAGVPSDQILNPHMEAVAMAKQLEMTTNALEATKAELAKIQAALAAAEANLGPGRVFA